MPMHRRVPIVATTERGSEFARWRDIRITVQDMTDLVWVFPVHASKSEFGKTLGGFFIKHGGRRIFGSERKGRKQNQQGQWNSHLPKCNRIGVDWRLRTLGSARVPRVGFGLSLKQSSGRNDAAESLSATGKSAMTRRHRQPASRVR